MASDSHLWPFTVYAVTVLLTTAAILAASWLLGPRHRQRTTGQPYESGSPPTGSARLRFSIGFYLVAMFFVIFDVESIFLFAWAVAWRQLGWSGYIEVLIFVAILLTALLYLWRLGALDWGMVGRKKNAAREGAPDGIP
jgi:NADH-quinone oxidoreductase subunit A